MVSAKAEDVIYLKSGKVIHGKIIKKVPGVSVKIKAKDGTVHLYLFKSIEKVTQSASASTTEKSKKSAEKSKKSKAAEKTAVVKKSFSENRGIINGVNNVGRPGYIYGDTAFTPNKNQFMGAVGLSFYTPGSQLSIPVGGAYGVMDNLQVHANTSIYSYAGASGLGSLVFGGKYGFKTETDNLLFALGLDFSDGPLSGAGYTAFNVDPYGIVTYTLPSGLQLNGQFGIMFLGGYSIDNPLYGFLPGQAKTISIGGGSYAQLNLGASKVMNDKLTGIAELDINGLSSGSSPLIVGVRGGDDLQWQLFAGLDLATPVGILIGGSLAVISR
jgi:hypothetical protein